MDWRDHAACRGSDVDLFFPVNDDEATVAIEICAQCPVRRACLEWALATNKQYGVWGGCTETERRRERRRRHQGERSA